MTTVRPRPALAVAVLAVVVLDLLDSVAGSPWLLLASAAALALVVVSVVLRPRLDKVTVAHALPRRVTVGGTVEVVLTVHNTSRDATPSLVRTWTHPCLGEHAVALPGLDPGEVQQVLFSATAQRRGVFTHGTATVLSTAPFGLLRWTRTTRCPGRLVVHPATQGMRALSSTGAPTAGDRSEAVVGAGTEVLGLRPFRPGDSPRHLSARATARHGRPVVLERERDSGPSLVLLATGGGSGAVWEAAVSRAASLCLAALREGRPPEVLAEPERAQVDATGLLDLFAELDLEPAAPSAALVQRAVRAAGPGGTLVLLAPPAEFEVTMAVRRAAARARVEVVVLGGTP